MSGLLVKELSVIRRYARQYVLIIVFFFGFSFYLKSPTYMQSMLTMVLAMLTLTGITYDNMAGWDKYVLTMPVDRKTIVLSKYMTTLIFGLIALALGAGGGILLRQVMPEATEGILEIAAVSGALFCVVLFIYGISLPLIFKFGVERTRSLIFAVSLLPVIIIFAVSRILPESTITPFLENHVGILAAGIAGFCAALYVISYFISVKIYEKKEF